MAEHTTCNEKENNKMKGKKYKKYNFVFEAWS
jgi:hypothetical protein